MERKKGVLIEHKKESYVKEKTTYHTFREFYVLQEYPLQRAYHNKVMKSSILTIREFYVLQEYPLQRAYHNEVMKSSILTIREFYVLQGYPLQRAYHNEVMKSSILSVICSSPIILSFLYDFC